MPAYVLDASLTAAWCFPDEQTSHNQAVLRALKPAGAIAPRLWAYEIHNTVLTGVRRKRISAAHAADFMRNLEKLPILLRDPVSYGAVYALAERYGLTFYDAAYLDLAVRERLPLASLDGQLAQASKREGVGMFQP